MTLRRLARNVQLKVKKINKFNFSSPIFAHFSGKSSISSVVVVGSSVTFANHPAGKTILFVRFNFKMSAINLSRVDSGGFVVDETVVGIVVVDDPRFINFKSLPRPSCS